MQWTVSYTETFSITPNLHYIQNTVLIVAYANLDYHMINITRAYTHTLIN
jgi:hypothetical protein